MDNLKDDARHRLLEAAVKLFVSKGYSATSVSMIVQEAKVTKPMLYYYFKNKAGIYTEIMNYAFVEFEAIMEKYPLKGVSAHEMILNMFIDLMDVQEKRMEYVRLMHAMIYGPPQGAPQIDFDEFPIRMADKVSFILHEGIENGELELMDVADFVTILLSVLFFCFDTRMIECSVKMTNDDLRRLVNKLFDKVLIKK
ncbi:MAG: TetR/AcrR family transcriptional regulator [Deferribacterales bacterium]